MRTAKRLTIVEDDPDILYDLRGAFEAEGYEVGAFLDALPMLRYVRENGLPHLALVDVNLPSMDGFELSRKLKQYGDVPIIFISAEGNPQIVAQGLDLYADDYVTKPLNFEVLAARVRRVLSRMANFEYALPPVIEVDDWLSIDFGQSKLQAGGKSIVLTPTEAGLLDVLLRHAGAVVASDTLISRVWPLEDVFEDTLRVHMHRLRRKIEPDHRSPRYITTERGVGYKFRAISAGHVSATD